VIKTIICLANSRKNAAHCIAGKDTESKRWIRPVSHNTMHEISKAQCKYQNGKLPEPLDIIRIAFKTNATHSHQPENMFIEDNICWEKVGSIQHSDLINWIDDCPLPWDNNHSTNGKNNDRVPIQLLKPEHGSLRLIFVDTVALKVQSRTFPGSAMEKKILRADFQHYGTRYCIDVTDPVIEKQYLQKGLGEYVIANSYICVSLGEIFGPFAYKLAAGIFSGDQSN